MFNQRLRGFLMSLITPAPTIRNEEDRDAARLLAAITLTLIGLMVVVLMLGFYRPLDMVAYEVVSSGMVATFAIYLLSRSRWYKPGILLLILIIIVSNVILMIHDANPYHSVFLVIPVFIISLFGSIWMTVAVAAVSLGLPWVIFGLIQVSLSRILVTMVFILIISVLIVITSIIRRTVQGQLRERTVQLEISEARFRAAIEGSLDSFYLLASVRDENGKIIDFRIVEVNERGGQLVNQKREDLLGQLFCERIPLIRAQGWMDKYIHVVETRELLEEEIKVNLPTGLVWLHHQLVPVGDGVAITTRNITERKAAEIALRDNEARNRAIIAALPDLLFVISRSGVYLDYYAPDLRKMLVSPELFLNRHVGDVMPPAIADQIMEGIDKAFLTQEMQLMEYTLDLEGGERQFEARIVTYQDDKVLTIIRDVTDRREAEQNALEVQIERERMRLLSNFIRSSSHEFRTPLAIISSGAYLMVKTEDRQERQERAQRVEEQVQSIRRLVDDLVLISRLDSGIMVECEPLDLYAITSQVVDAMKTAASKKQQNLIFKPESQHVMITGNLDFISLALMNLVENAALYTNTGSEITVLVEKIGTNAMVFVEDDGPGMTLEIQAHIFETFYRGDAAQSIRGLGLGLPIAKKVVELHGGEIQVDSQPEKGSLFTVILPRILDQDVKPASASSPATPDTDYPDH